mgnify:CR=1 FL=1
MTIKCQGEEGMNEGNDHWDCEGAKADGMRWSISSHGLVFVIQIKNPCYSNVCLYIQMTNWYLKCIKNFEKKRMLRWH